MDYIIREIERDECELLDDFLYHAIFVPEGTAPPPLSVIREPDLQVYVEGFGRDEHDKALVAEANGKVIGAVWVRIMNDYGHVDDETPSFAISLYPRYRGMGIGTAMMLRMLELLKESGCRKASLSVQKANYAVRLYEKLGFKIVHENADEYIMVKLLDGSQAIND